MDLVITTQELQQLLEEEASISHAGDVSLFLQSLMKEHKHNGSADERMSIFHAINEGIIQCVICCLCIGFDGIYM